MAESRNTQLGIVLNGLTIESMIIGSPSQHSKQLAIGDVIMKIDGIVATQTNVRSLLIGSDVPGTAVILSVLKLRSQVRLIDIHDTSWDNQILYRGRSKMFRSLECLQRISQTSAKCSTYLSS